METQNEVEVQDLPADVRAELKAGHVAAFSKTESALANLRKDYEGIVYAVEIAAGMAEAKAARKEIVTYRTSLEKKRKEIKAPYLDYCRLLDGEAARITGELEALEKPIDDQIKAEEKRLSDIKAEADRKEAARVQAHQNGLESIRAIAGSMIGASLEVLRATLHKVEAIKFSDYEEFEESAKLYAEAAAEKLNQLITSEQEKIAAKELQVKAEAEAARVAKIQMWMSNIQNAPSQAFGSTIEGLAEKVVALGTIDLTKYDEFAETAAQYRDEAIEKIEQMITDATELKNAHEAAEKLAAAQAEKQREQDRIQGIKNRIQLISSHAQNLHRYSLETVRHNLSELESTELLPDSFGDLYDVAVETKNGAVECMKNHIAIIEKANADAEELAQFKAQKARDEQAALDAQKAKDAEADRARLTAEENKALADEFVADIIVEAFEDALSSDNFTEFKNLQVSNLGEIKFTETGIQTNATFTKEAEVTRAQVITLVSDIYSLTKDEAENILKILFAN